MSWVQARYPQARRLELRKNCKAPRGQFSHGSACHMYVNCWDDVVIEESCPGGLLFNEKGYCDYDYNVECGDRKIESEYTVPYHR
ncbi:unnamed protein product [Timema podura]|uniref:Chitin-binding type-2 domain-containing protein n=1 Tax=Timema podura TaxID=61482 RepID=A0ABN7P9P3_TIMPD|nr:unnamed protein product [Timema podura]